MGFFFSPRADNTVDDPIFNPGGESTEGFLDDSSSEYPFSFSFDATPFVFEDSSQSSPSNSDLDSSSGSDLGSSSEDHWSDIEGIDEWVDLGNLNSDQ